MSALLPGELGSLAGLFNLQAKNLVIRSTFSVFLLFTCVCVYARAHAFGLLNFILQITLEKFTLACLGHFKGICHWESFEAQTQGQ